MHSKTRRQGDGPPVPHIFVVCVDIVNTAVYNLIRKDVAVMAQQFIHVRVNSDQKRNAEIILNNLGLTMTKGIHLFLNSVIKNKGLPFELKENRDDLLGFSVAEMERGYQRAVLDDIETDRAKGYPIALYDKKKKSAYLEYPDRKREYIGG